MHPVYAVRGRGRGWRHRWRRGPVLADATDAVDAVAAGDSSMLPADDGFAPARGAATDSVRSAAEAAVPVRDGCACVGSTQSDSPKGGAHEQCNLREPPCAVGFSAPTSSPPHISVVTDTEGALRSAPMPTTPAPQPPGRPFPGAPPRGGRIHFPAVRLLLCGGKRSHVG